ncbi:MAG: M48 family metalloprotease [Gammaproteobacteria bacterium]|nr:M48 family metalloprotease [Gammaproteobacteria bacterium]MDH5803495.1 M48 family metalloprotease [Gammaproteobacteria bacterium]
MISVIPVVASELPDLGSSADVVLSREEEKRLADEFLNYIQNSLKLADDPLSTEYIQNLGDKLAAHMEEKQNFTFFIVEDPSINAFAGPGGYIGIHTGLIFATHSEDELASVLAHEIAHVTQRHLLRSMDRGSKMTWPSILAIFAAMAVGDAQVGNAVLASTIAGTVQSKLSYSRDYEHEADRIGIRLLSQAGFDPKAMPTFFKTLQQQHQYSDTGLPEFLRTHPITASRIADSQELAAQIQPLQAQDATNYSLTTARLYYHYHSKKKSSQSGLPTRNSKAVFVEQYEQAIIHLKNEQYSTARKLINDIIRKDRPRLPYLITQAEIEYQQKEYNNAIKVLDTARLFYPNALPLTSLHVSSLIKNQQAHQALQLLDKQLRQTPDNAALYKLKAQACTGLNQPKEAHEAMADHYRLIGNIHGAIKHLKSSLKLAENNRTEKLRLTAKIQQLKEKVIANQPPPPKPAHLSFLYNN